HGDPGGVDEPVDVIVAAPDVGDHTLPVMLRGDVEHVIRTVAAGNVAGDRHPAGLGDCFAHSSAHRACGARDQHDFVLQSAHGFRDAPVMRGSRISIVSPWYSGNSYGHKALPSRS